MLLHSQTLVNSKNLLAFSAGVDSTALLFLLLENNIQFDIAIVNYGLRTQAEEEVLYAQELANTYNFKCHILNAKKIESNFEANARKIRYDFFEDLVLEMKYENLLTAHHLGDRLEWMLMQFCKGAGCAELSGMSALDKRENYTLVRPLLHLDKQELLKYLNAKKINYFLDKSNSDEKYRRNEFRHNYAKPLLAKYLNGIKKSFEYIDSDINELITQVKLKKVNQFTYFVSVNKRSDIFAVDRYMKSIGQLITANEKDLLKNEKVVVLGRKFVVSQDKNYVFVAPYIKTTNMPKEFKEKMRRLGIEPKLRAYLSTDEEAVELLSLLLQ